MSGSSKQTTVKRLSKGNKSNPAETSSDDEVNILYENIYTKFLKKRQCADGTKITLYVPLSAYKYMPP